MEKERENLKRVLVGKGTDHERWEWRIKGTDLWHHPTEPAIEYKNGNWTWHWMNVAHRWDGPAQYVEGKYQYWIHGRELTKEEWERNPLRLEWLGNKLGGI